MNQTTTIVGGIIVIVVLVLGFLTFNNYNAAPTTATSTPVTVDTGNQNPPVTSQDTPGAPVATTNSSVIPTDTTVVVTGSVMPNGAFTSYWYEFGPSSTLGNKTSTQTVGSGYNSIPTPAYITGLVKDTTYYYRVVAQNSLGKSAGVTHSFVTTHGNPPPVGNAPNPRTSAATGITRTTANVAGTVTPNQATTQYWFEYGTSANLGNTTAFVSVGDGTASVPASQSLSNLQPATTYFFRINAQNEFGTVNGAILSFKTAGPAVVVPTSPTARTGTATPVSTSTATLRGTVDPKGADTTYWFEYSTDSLLGSVLLKSTSQVSLSGTAGSSAVMADVSGLVAKTNYYFRVVAQNSQGTVRGDRSSFRTK